MSAFNSQLKPADVVSRNSEQTEAIIAGAVEKAVRDMFIASFRAWTGFDQGAIKEIEEILRGLERHASTTQRTH